MANIINGTDTGSGGLITTGDSSDELQLQTAETARVTLTNTAVVVNEGGNDVDFRVESDTDANALFVEGSSGNVGFGTSSPASFASKTLEIYGSSIATLKLTNATTGTGNTAGIEFEANGNDLTIVNRTSSGYTRFFNNGSERLRVLSSGGITFNGDTAAANALDDYEEGTWTPAFQSGVAGTGRVTNVLSANYTKIGNLVYVQCFVEMGTLGTGGSGLWYLQGLPFTAQASGMHATAAVSYWQLLTNGLVYLSGTVQPGETSILFRGIASSTGNTANLNFADYVQQGTQVILSASYPVL